MKLKLLFLLISLCANGIAQSAENSASEHYDDALKKLNEGANVKEVFQILDNCLEKDSTYENAYFLRAYIHYKLEDFEAAIREYDALLSINPYHMEALKNRALTRIQVYDLEGAIEDHNRRLILEPTNAVIYFDRAYCKGLLNDIHGSIEDYSKAIELDPSFREAIVNRGKAKMNLATSGAPASISVSIPDACSDLNKARVMGDTTGIKLLTRYCGEMQAQH